MIPEHERRLLNELVWESIRHGWRAGGAAPVALGDLPAGLSEPRACFITLETADGDLRGCIGTLDADEPLAVAVSGYAYAAAFEDPRFEPVRPVEEPSLRAHISVLTPAIPLAAADEAAARAKLRPGQDGVILEDGRRRATFLPSVWEQLPDSRDFLLHLKRKAGLPDDHWSPATRLSVYQAEAWPVA